MSLPRQGGHYLLIGGVQWLVDWGVMVLLSHLGLPVEAANICGRISGASLGFWLNGRITFAADGDVRLGRRRFLRFALMWIVWTALGTALMHYARLGFGDDALYVVKPAIEAFLAALSFLSSRFFVYR